MRIEATFQGPDLACAGPDSPARTITGLAVPWDVRGTVADGRTVVFARDSLTPSARPVVLLHHDSTRPIGVVSHAESIEGGMVAALKISATRDGDEALTLAADGALTGLSVGVEVTDHVTAEDGTVTVTAGQWSELSLVVAPAFAPARVSTVAAAAAEQDSPMSETETAPVVETAPAVDTPAPAVFAAAPARTAVQIPSLGEYLTASLQRQQNPTRYARVVETLTAAAPHTFLTDVGGLNPVAIYGDILAPRPTDRPALTALGIRPGPAAGSAWTRPIISDPIADAAAATEKTDVTDQMKVTSIDVAYTFVKRAANLSAEAIAFTSPSALEATAADLARAYARGTEKVAATYLNSLGGTGTAVAAGDEVEAIFAASASIYAATGTMADTLFVSPDVWAYLGGLKATDGRPLFPFVGATNSPGTSGGAGSFSLNVLGLQMVVSWAFAASTSLVASSDYLEGYEAHQVSMRVDEPTILGTSIGIGGAVAAIATVPAAVVKLTGLSAAPGAAKVAPTK